MPVLLIKKNDKQGHPYLEVSRSGYSLLTNPLLNKGMSFSETERLDFNLLGLLPPHYSTLEEQRERSYQVFKNKNSELEKYSYLRDLQDSNETVFYSLLTTHITEMLPIVYTPVVGAACQHLSQIYRRPRVVSI